jgi:hypothetical protein
MSVGTVLFLIVLAFTVLPWWSIIMGQRNSVASLLPVFLLTVSSVIQLSFIFLVDKNFLALEYSWRFALLGLPFCVLSLVVAQRRKRSASDLPRNTVACAIAGLAMWIFLSTLR